MLSIFVFVELLIQIYDPKEVEIQDQERQIELESLNLSEFSDVRTL